MYERQNQVSTTQGRIHMALQPGIVCVEYCRPLFDEKYQNEAEVYLRLNGMLFLSLGRTKYYALCH